MLSQWETVVLDRATTLIEGLLRRGLSDSDPTARKHTRRSAALRPYLYMYTCIYVLNIRLFYSVYNVHACGACITSD